MEKSLIAKMWVDFEEKGQPSEWITMRALLALGLGHSERSVAGSRTRAAARPLAAILLA